MQEGVLAIDKNNKLFRLTELQMILEINNLDDTIQESFNNISVLAIFIFIKKLPTKKQATKDMTLNALLVKQLGYRFSATNEKGVNIGALIVMRDITDLVN